MARKPITQTLGHLQLRALLQLTTASAIAARCHVAPSTVSQWANQQRKPSESGRLLLFRNYQIPPIAWRMPAKRNTSHADWLKLIARAYQ